MDLYQIVLSNFEKDKETYVEYEEFVFLFRNRTCYQKNTKGDVVVQPLDSLLVDEVFNWGKEITKKEYEDFAK